MTSTRLQEEFVTLLQAHVPDLERNGSKATGSVPWREDAHPSLSADLDKAVWYDRARKQGGGVKEFKAQLGLNGTAPEKQIVDTYDYVDENNILLYQVIRYDDKTFSQRKPDGKEGWIWNLRGVRRVPYRLSDILDKPTIYIVEGEKDADRLWSLGFPATTNPHGAGQWRAEYNPHFTGKHVVLFPDYDEPGEAHGLDVASNLEPVAESVKIVRLPGLPLKGDVSDWLDQGHTKEELEAIVDATPALKPEDLKAKPSNGHSEATWPELDNAALHGLAGEIVSTIDPYTEADPVATLLNVLTAFGNCVNAAPHARVQHDKHPARLFVVLVGDTSKGRKGTGWSTPRYLFSRCDPD